MRKSIYYICKKIDNFYSKAVKLDITNPAFIDQFQKDEEEIKEYKFNKELESKVENKFDNFYEILKQSISLNINKIINSINKPSEYFNKNDINMLGNMILPLIEFFAQKRN